MGKKSELSAEQRVQLVLRLLSKEAQARHAQGLSYERIARRWTEVGHTHLKRRPLARHKGTNGLSCPLPYYFFKIVP
jgi:hypothetical protein